MNEHRMHFHQRHVGEHEEAHTVNLPRTTFPMRANLPRREVEILQFWQEIGLYERAQERTRGGPPFLLHDGPPFSYGDIHLGHALNKILKDIIVKFRSMQGFDAPLIPGWDTHGLTTEIEALRAFPHDRHAIDPLALRARCAKLAEAAITRQREQFIRLGVRADWDRPYLTMQPKYEATVLETFAGLVERQLIYQALKVVHWCPGCRSALAAAEVEQRACQVSAAYIAFPVLAMPEAIFAGIERTRMSAVVWTPSPWTLPAGVAIAAHPSAPYVLVSDEKDREGFTYIVARAQVEAFTHATRMKIPRIDDEVSGQLLDGLLVQHPLLGRQVPLVLSDAVSPTEGSGLTQLAPGHHEGDFLLAGQAGLPVVQIMDATGVLGAEAGPYAGKPLMAAQQEMLRRLDRDGTLLAHDLITRDLPQCWRCQSPVIMRATPQWFFAAHRLTDACTAALDQVTWAPSRRKAPFVRLLQERPDWCISRQHVWGIPLPVVSCTACGTPWLSGEIIHRAAGIIREEGSDAWHQRPVADFVPDRAACPQCGGTDFHKDTDTFDVWFDSACSHLAVLDSREDTGWPADLYLEGHDQLRGWFQASLLTSTGVGRGAPYRSVLAHGSVLDRTGGSQARSRRSLSHPQAVVRRHGADVLRLWAASADPHRDVLLSDEVLSRLAETYRRLRNTFRFLLGNLHDFSPETALCVEELAEVDRWALDQLDRLIEAVTAHYDAGAIHRAVHAIIDFCANDLSGFYLDAAKGWLYTSLLDSHARRSSQTVLYQLATTLAQLLAPVLSFTADEAWRHLPEAPRALSVQLTDWPTPQAAWRDDALAARRAQFLAVRDLVCTAVRQARRHGRIPQARAAKVTVYSAGEIQSLLESLVTPAKLLLVSDISFASWDERPPALVTGALPQLGVIITTAAGEPCPRCRFWCATVGSVPGHPSICANCAEMLEAGASGDARKMSGKNV